MSIMGRWFGTWLQWNLGFWWKASSLSTKHAKISGINVKLSFFIYGFFSKNQNSQYVGKKKAHQIASEYDYQVLRLFL
jgi:hypothetical protein